MALKKYDKEVRAFKVNPIIVGPAYARCESCGQPDFHERGLYSHADMCQYYTFRDVEAPTLGMVSIEDFLTDDYTGPYLVAIFTSIGLEHRAFQFGSMANGGWDIFVSQEIAQSMKMFLQGRPQFADMSLEEWLCRMFDLKPI